MAKSFKEVLEEVPVVANVPDIITDSNSVRTPSTETTIEEAEKIWPLLEAVFDSSKMYGISAVQIGIPKKVGLIKYNNKIIKLLNTRLISGTNPVPFYNEGCLSVVGKTVNTSRFQTVTIFDTLLGEITFTSSVHGLLPAILQHEIDHFEGKLILDRQLQPYKHEGKQYGRNDLCPKCGIKLKKCEHKEEFLVPSASI
jgi:peptide deformylase